MRNPAAASSNRVSPLCPRVPLHRVGFGRRSLWGFLLSAPVSAGDLIVVWDPATHFYAIYSKPSDQPQLILKRRRPSKDHELLAQAWQVANEKARELGWIV